MDTLLLKKLKLLAKDVEDLQIIAAHLQDSLVPFLSMKYDPAAQTFTFLANRFCWEHGEITHEDRPLYHRVHTGIAIHNVTKVQKKGFDSSNRLFNLLTIHANNAGALHMIFSDHHEIRAEIDDLHLKMGDIHHPWPTRLKPKHLHEHLAELYTVS